MKITRLTISITLITLAQFAVSQTGTVRFSINPGHNFEVKIDGDTIVTARTLELTTGRHELSIWAPTYDVLDTAVTIKAGVEKSIIFELERSSEWLEWDQDYRESRKRRIPLTTISTSVGVAGIVFGGWKYNQYRQSHLTNLDLVEQYENEVTPNKLIEIKQELDDNLVVTKKRQNGALIGTAVGITGLLGMVYFNKKIDVHELPEWEDKQGIKFHDLSYLYFPDHTGGLHGFSLTMKF